MGFSDFFIVYGQKSIKPIDLIKGFNQNPASKSFVNHIVMFYKIVKTRLVKAQAVQKG